MKKALAELINLRYRYNVCILRFYYCACMIPLTIQLKNFLSYGEPAQTISFGKYPLICLSGKNGHGKSALLDAITWALWGQARKTSNSVKPDALLVHLGKEHMLVIFDFLLNNIHYRIRREFSHNHGKGYTSLDIGIIDPTKEYPTPLTGKTIKATQEVINTIVGIDFDSFINSTFLRQGNANEFSKKSPKERKDILGSILGLHTYEKVRKTALEKARYAQQEKNILIPLLEQLSKKIENKELVINELYHLTVARTSIQEQITTTRESLKKTTATIQEMNKQKEQIEITRTTHTNLERHKHQLLNNLSTAITQYRSTLCQPPTISRDELQKNLIDSMQQLSTLEETRNTIIMLQEKKTAIDQQINGEIKKLYTALHTEQLKQERLRAEQLQQIHTLEQHHAKLVTLIEKDQADIHRLTLMIKDIEQSAEYTFQEESIITVNTRLEKQIRYLEKYEQLATHKRKSVQLTINNRTQLTTTHSSSCPLCTQTLTRESAHNILINLTNEITILTHQIKRLEHILHDLPDTIEQNRNLLSTYNQIRNKKNQYITRLDLYNKHRQEIITLHDQRNHELITIAHSINTIQATLLPPYDQATLLDTLIAQNQTYQDAVTTKKMIDEQLNGIAYNHQHYEQLKKQIATTQHQLDAYYTYEKITVQKKIVRNTIHQYVQSLKEININLYQLQETLKQCPYDSTAHEEQLAHYTSLENTISNLVKQEHILIQDHTRLITTLDHIKKIEEDMAEYTKLIQELNTMSSDYQIIAHLLGKDGIQAMIIEDAIPEIEHHANQLLARLTNNQAHLIIDSLRDLKNGSIKETLDIKVSDNLGVRPYELFSGGEAFRIDFALRIAISKLVAHKAGTTLQTLIIDEGFGSQDEEGLHHIMEALYTIQEDFEKIIIVSHLAALKDQFPVHFMVQKGISGTTVHIVEHA